MKMAFSGWHACWAARGFPPYLKSDRLRRIRLASFPFVVVYRVHADTVRVLLLKHERRAPGFGAERR